MDSEEKGNLDNKEETQNFIKDIKNSVNNDIFEQFLKKNNARFDVDEESQESSAEEDSESENFNEEDFEALMQTAGENNKKWKELRN